MLDVLKEWCINFVKYKDIFSKKLIDFKVEKDTIEFNFKDKKHLYLIKPLLDDSVSKSLKDEFVTIICLNKKENLNFLKAKWKELIKFERLNLIFVNPKTNDKWIINPNIHERISETDSFSLGLNSLFESVPEFR